jgi:hypothetical protein
VKRAELTAKDMGIIAPSPRQLLALECPAREVLMGGGKGGGKSAFLTMCWNDLWQLADQKFKATGRTQGRCRVVVFRKNLEDLKDFIIKTHDVMPGFGGKFGVQEKTWTLPSGATMSMRHLDGPHDHLGYNGNEFVGLGFDEVQQIPYEAYKFLAAQVRSGDPDYHARRRIRCTCNFDGYDWPIQHWSLDDFPMGNKIIERKYMIEGEEHSTSRAFVRSLIKDNPYLAKDYVAQLVSLMNEDEIAIYIDGDHRRIPGSFFSRFIQPSLHFRKPRILPASWQWSFAIDWGSSAPACLLVGALDPEGCLWVVDEIHRPGKTGRYFGELMANLWAENRWSDQAFRPSDFWGVIDKQAMDDNGAGQTAGDGIQSAGFRIFPANKERSAGCNQMKERFLATKDQKTRLVIFEDRCPNLVRALLKIKSDAPGKPDEYEPRSDFAHAADAFRFLCMRFPVTERNVGDPIEDALARWHRIINLKHSAPEDVRMTSGYEQ